ncbi:PREDICTED: uncharacterized protein LOC109131132 [Camelina sativa]|uniref:Uncharacterized protein LOC109131132 n=1 Tax=Camelina sativa TaxID=90675 RepID=A0ABM1RE49_CAMSA|nr:PREDICTED: uncharacterized protein LOC109131132 [Camelina sativa]
MAQEGRKEPTIFDTANGLEKHQDSEPAVTVGCLSNLYRSVVDMKIDDFETEACKQMLLYPKNIRESRYINFKLNIDPTESLLWVMNEEISFSQYEKFEDSMQKDVGGVFSRDKSSFIITDDLIFTFLAVPLEFVCDINLDSIGNLRRSFKDLTVVDHTASKCVLPYYYKCQKQLSGITTEEPPVYYRYRLYNVNEVKYGLTKNGNLTPLYRNERIVRADLMDPKSSGSNKSTHCYGFLKKETKFTVLDDLTITSMNSCSTISLLKKLQSHADDLEVKVISISNAEALNLLRASLVTSSALSTALWSLFAEKLKEETDLWNPVSKKVKEGRRDLKK